MSQMILVVDDSAMVRRYVRQELEKLGYLVSEAEDGEAAMALLSKVHPALVISDVNMAPMGGFVLLGEIRKRFSREHLPVLMLTTESDQTMKEQGKAAGANGWLVKPFEPTRMGEVVRHVLSKSNGVANRGVAR